MFSHLFSHRTVALCVTLLTGSACSSPFESATPFSLTATAVLSKGPYARATDQSFYTCDFTFSVVGGGGSSGDNATFSSAQINYTLRDNGQTAAQTIGTSDLVGWFGQASVASGETRTAVRSFSWTGPFTARVSFSFNMNTRATAGVNVITVPLGCGTPAPAF